MLHKWLLVSELLIDITGLLILFFQWDYKLLGVRRVTCFFHLVLLRYYWKNFSFFFFSMAPHSSTLAWKTPWAEEAGRLQSMGSLSRTRLSNFTFTFHFHALEKEMATHSSVLAWRIPGMGEPGGLPSMGLHRVGHHWSDLAIGIFARGHSFCPLLISMSEAFSISFIF